MSITRYRFARLNEIDATHGCAITTGQFSTHRIYHFSSTQLHSLNAAGHNGSCLLLGWSLLPIFAVSLGVLLRWSGEFDSSEKAGIRCRTGFNLYRVLSEGGNATWLVMR